MNGNFMFLYRQFLFSLHTIRTSTSIIKVVLILCWFISISTTLLAQPISFSQLTIDDGLSQNTVNDIIQDDIGFIWFATQEGLNRYNGLSFRNFLEDSKSPELGPPGNWIISLDYDGYSSIWLGTNGQGFARLDLNTYTFDHYLEINSVLPSRINDIVYNNNRLYIAYQDAGAFYIPLNDDHLINEATQPVQIIPPIINTDAIINKIEVINSNEILFVSSTHGLFHYFINEDKYVTIQPTLDSITNLSLYTAEKIDDTIFWLGVRTGGLLQYDAKNQQIEPIPYAQPKYLLRSNVSIIYKHKNSIWIGTENAGLFVKHLDGKNSGFIHYYRQSPSPNGITDNTFYSAFVDNEDILWFGTFLGGVNYISTYKNKFTNLYHVPGDPQTLKYNLSKSFTQIGDDLWIATRGGGISIYNMTEFRFNVQLSDNINSILPDQTLNTITYDRSRYVWIGSWGTGLYRYDLRSDSYDHFSTEKTGYHQISDNFIRDINVDDKGRVWIGAGQSGSGGLHIIWTDGSMRNVHIHKNMQKRSLSLPNNSVNKIFFNTQKDVWIGSFGGLSRLRFNSDSDLTSSSYSLQNLSNNSKIENGLPGDIVTSFTKNSSGELWLSTYGGGFAKVILDNNGEIDHFKTITRKDGLSTNNVFGILTDNEDHIWLSTNQGLGHFMPNLNIVLNYSKYDGLGSTQFNQGAFLKLTDGRMVFGGLNGTTFLKPDQIDMPEFNPPLLITSITIQGKPLKSDVIIPKVKNLVLDKNQNSFSIEVLALTNIAPDNISYYYKLEGFNRDWVFNDKRRYINYTNVPYGKYTFRLKAANAFGQQKLTTISLPIEIIPPFYRHPLFLILSVILILAAIFGFGRYRELQLVKINRDLEKRVEDRTQDLKKKTVEAERANAAKSDFLAGMSHELRTPLNAILGFSQILNRANDLPERYQRYADIMYRSGNHLLTMINDVLDISKIEAGRMEIRLAPVNFKALIKDVELMFTLQSKKQNLVFSTHLNDDVPNYLITDQSKIRQVLINLIGNAIKFTKKGEIKVELKKITLSELPSCQYISPTPEILDSNQEYIFISVNDTGPGLDEISLIKVFEPFRRHAHQPVSGTGLGLAISEKLIAMLGGCILAESQPGEGSTFAFVFPINQVASASVEDINKDSDLKLTDEFINTPILIVDDIESNVDVLESMLSDAGFRTLIANNGTEALHSFEIHKPGIILLDLRMPGISGEEVMKTIRNMEGIDQPTIIAITASIFDENIKNLIESGFDDVIIKPFVESNLYRTIEKRSNLIFENREDDRTDSTSDSASHQHLMRLILELPSEQQDTLKELLSMTDLESISDWFEQLSPVDSAWKAFEQNLQKRNYRYFLTLYDEIMG